MNGFAAGAGAGAAIPPYGFTPIAINTGLFMRGLVGAVGFPWKFDTFLKL